MSVSIATPDSQILSIHSLLETIVSEPPRKILSHDVNKLLSYLHDNNAARDAQHEELTDHLHAIEDELLDLPHPHSTLHPNQRHYTDDTGSYTFSTVQYPRAAPSNGSNSGFVFKIVSRLHWY
jgi:hypothetical protein